MGDEVKVKSRRGFAAMSPEKRKELASRGGKRAHELGVANTFNKESASEAGRKGGRAFHRKRGRTVIVAEGQPTLMEVFAREEGAAE